MALEPFASTHKGLISFLSDDDYVLAQKLVNAGFSLQIFRLRKNSFNFSYDKIEFMVTNGCEFDLEHLIENQMITRAKDLINFVDLWLSCNDRLLLYQWRILVSLALDYHADPDFAEFFEFVLSKNTKNYTMQAYHANRALGKVDAHYLELILNSIRDDYCQALFPSFYDCSFEIIEFKIFMDVFLRTNVKNFNFEKMLSALELIDFVKINPKNNIEFYSNVYVTNSFEFCEYLADKGIDIYNIPDKMTVTNFNPQFVKQLYDRGVLLHEKINLNNYIFNAIHKIIEKAYSEQVVDEYVECIKSFIDGGCVKEIYETMIMAKTTTWEKIIVTSLMTKLCNKSEEYKTYYGLHYVETKN
jgi:hypothetical protein